MPKARLILDMNETICSFAKTPREITQTLKRLSIAAESLGAITSYFFSWPSDPDNYNTQEWIAPLELIEVQGQKTVLCKVPDPDFFVNLYFMRWWRPVLGKPPGVLTFALVDHKNGEQIKDSLINVINKFIDREAKQPQSLQDLNRAIHRECLDPSLCIYSIRKEDPLKEGIQSVEVTASCGEQTPKSLARILSE